MPTNGLTILRLFGAGDGLAVRPLTCPVVHVALHDLMRKMGISRQLRTKKLPGFQTIRLGETDDGFEPDLFLSSGFELLVEFEAEAGEFGEFLLGKSVPVT